MACRLSNSSTQSLIIGLLGFCTVIRDSDILGSFAYTNQKCVHEEHVQDHEGARGQDSSNNLQAVIWHICELEIRYLRQNNWSWCHLLRSLRSLQLLVAALLCGAQSVKDNSGISWIGLRQPIPHTAMMLFSPFVCIYQPTSPCSTISTHTEPISLGHCWKWHHKLFDTYMLWLHDGLCRH